MSTIVSTNLHATSKKHWLQGVVHSKVETTIDNDSNTGNVKSTVKPGKTIRSHCFPIDINEPIELPPSSLLCSLGIIGQTGSSIIQ